MITIEIDTGALEDTYDLQSNQIDGFKDKVIKDIALAFWAAWREEASKGLGGTRKEFLQSLVVEDRGIGAAAVVLKGSFPNMIEQGASAFDMKIGFANSPKAKPRMGKNGPEGWFLTIPFRHGTPGALEENFSSVMTQEVYDKVQVKGKLRSKDLPDAFKNKGERARILDKSGNILFDKYEHKTAQLAGLVQVSKRYAGATQSQYMTFRRVSDKSSPLSWIHPGMDAKNFGDKAFASFDGNSIIAAAKDEFLDSLGL